MVRKFALTSRESKHRARPMLTVIDDDRQRTLGSHLREEGFEGFGVQRACEVPAGDDDHIVCTGLCSFVTELNRLTGASCAGTSDDRHIRMAGVIKRAACGLNERFTFRVGEVDSFAHGSRNERSDIGLD